MGEKREWREFFSTKFISPFLYCYIGYYLLVVCIVLVFLVSFEDKNVAAASGIFSYKGGEPPRRVGFHNTKITGVCFQLLAGHSLEGCWLRLALTLNWGKSSCP
ncbi:hypothetical protein AAZX31_20G213600 [Glycine max]